MSSPAPVQLAENDPLCPPSIGAMASVNGERVKYCRSSAGRKGRVAHAQAARDDGDVVHWIAMRQESRHDRRDHSRETR
jgi:hypothetical protein